MNIIKLCSQALSSPQSGQHWDAEVYIDITHTCYSYKAEESEKLSVTGNQIQALSSPLFHSSKFKTNQGSVKNGEGLGTPITRMTSSGRKVDVGGGGGGGGLPINQLMCNKRWSEILTSEVEYCQSCEPQESWLSFEHSMMKSSMLFECGPLPPYVHLASTRRHSRDRCSQTFSVFRILPLQYIILNENRRTRNGGGLGTRLSEQCMTFLHTPDSQKAKAFLIPGCRT